MKKILFMTFAMLLTFTATYAQEKKDDAKPETQSVARIKLAKQLAKYGYETYSASALIEAAQILADVQTQDLSDAEYNQGNGADEKSSNANGVLSVEKLINDAKDFASGDETLLALANKVNINKGNSRGAVGGPKIGSSYVYGGGTDTYTVYFKKGVSAEVLVSGDGSTDLDLYIYDANGNLITYDDDYSDDCYVIWTPAWTGKFKIQIVNRGRYINYYNIATN